MNIEKRISENGTLYFSMTQVLKELSLAIDDFSNRAIKTELSRIPSHHYFKDNKGKGRHSQTFIDNIGLSMWINYRRNMPHDFKNKLCDLIKQEEKITKSSGEGYFMYNLCAFLQVMGITEVRQQKIIGDYTADLVIQNKYIIEYDEIFHEQQKIQDEIRDLNLTDLGYRVIRISSKISIGQAIAEIYKQIQ